MNHQLGLENWLQLARVNGYYGGSDRDPDLATSVELLAWHEGVDPYVFAKVRGDVREYTESRRQSMSYLDHQGRLRAAEVRLLRIQVGDFVHEAGCDTWVEVSSLWLHEDEYERRFDSVHFPPSHGRWSMAFFDRVSLYVHRAGLPWAPGEASFVCTQEGKFGGRGNEPLPAHFRGKLSQRRFPRCSFNQIRSGLARCACGIERQPDTHSPMQKYRLPGRPWVWSPPVHGIAHHAT